jgi:hypothetical protein
VFLPPLSKSGYLLQNARMSLEFVQDWRASKWHFQEALLGSRFVPGWISGAAVFGKMRRPGAPTVLADTRSVEDVRIANEFLLEKFVLEQTLFRFNDTYLN